MQIRTPTEIGALVRTARLERGWTQQQTALAAGVSRRFLVQLEAGHPNAEMWRVLTVLDTLGVALSAGSPDAPDQHVPPPADVFDLDAHLAGFRPERTA